MSTPELASISDVTTVAVEVTAGDPLQVDIPLVDLQGVAIALGSGNVDFWSARAAARRNRLADTPLHTWTTAAGVPNAVLVHGAAGKIRLTATGAETALWQDWPSLHAALDVAATGPFDGPTRPRVIASGTLLVRPHRDTATGALPEIPLTIRGGEPLDVTVPVLDAAGVPASAASIASARAQVRAYAPGGPLLHEWTTLGASPNATVTSGGVRLQATAAETLTWQTVWAGRAPMWDLLVVDTTGTPRRLTDPSPVHVDPVLTY